MATGRGICDKPSPVVVPGDKTEIDAEWYIDTSVAAAKIGKKDRVNYLSETLREHVLGFILTADYLTADASLKGSKLLKVGF